jgi:flagellar hook-basal body complex protein FliE
MSTSLYLENLSGTRVGPQGFLRETQVQNRDESTSLQDLEAASSSPSSFAQMIEKSIERVNTLQQKADHSVKELIAGRTKNIHGTMLDLERADLSLKLLMQVRNKIMDAYKEIIRMQV